MQRVVLDGHMLVRQYLRRLEDFGFDPQQIDNKQPDKKHAG
jgi:hypothetical protein